MKILLCVFALFTLGGCASLPGTSAGTAQPVNVMMQVLLAASSLSANGCIPPITAADPATACAPTTATDANSVVAAFNACLTATATQLILSNVKLPRCQMVPAPTPVPVPVPTPPIVVIPGPQQPPIVIVPVPPTK